MRRPLLAAVTALSLVTGLAACGDDDVATSATTVVPAATTTTAGSTTTSAPATTTTSIAATTTTAMAPTTAPADPGRIDFTIGVDQPGATHTVALGTDVTITVTSDSDEELHLHGYDLEQRVAAGVPAVLSFTADQAGSFDVETHTTGDLLFTLVVVA